MSEKSGPPILNNVAYFMMGLCLGVIFYSLWNIHSSINAINDDIEKIDEQIEVLIN